MTNRRVMYRVVGHLVVLAGFLVLGSSCDSHKPTPRPGSPNVLLILVDTLRADKLGCYGNSLGLTPNIDALSKQSAVFKNSFSHAPWTMPSVASLITSSYPEQNGVGGNVEDDNFSGIADSVTTLAECVSAKGYNTHAIVNVLFLDSKFGFGRGFAKEDYDYHRSEDNRGKRDARQTTDAALSWLGKQSDQAFFLMVHYFDAHLIYDPPAEFRKKFALKADEQLDPKLFGTAHEMRALHEGRVNIRDVPVDRLEHLYNAEVAYVDQQVGRLLQQLTTLGIDKKTIIVFTADHGEEFLDHGSFEHGHTLYDELLHIPLIVRYPNEIKKPCVIETTVRHIDVAPTILDLAGMDAEPKFVGQSLVELLGVDRGPDRMVLSEGHFWGPKMVALRDAGFKLIEKLKGRELYNVKVDPKEKENLLQNSIYDTRRDQMLRKLDVVQKAILLRATGKRSTIAWSEEDRRILDSVGYLIGGSSERTPTSGKSTPASTSSNANGNDGDRH